MQKGIIYCRVSSQEQVQGTSLENQKEACLNYANSKGIEVMRVFIEKGESATAANRTELIKVLDYCREQKGQISAFIVWKILPQKQSYKEKIKEEIGEETVSS